MAEERTERRELTNEEESEEQGEAPKKKGGGIIKIVIAAVAVVAVVIIGWLGWTFGQAMFFPTGESNEAEQATSEAGGSNPDGFDPENPPGILEFEDAFLIKLRRQEGVLQSDTYLKVNLTLEVGDAEVQAEMAGSAAIMSRISDTVLTFFASKYPDEIETSNWPRLKQELRSQINSQFPKKYSVRRVNFKEFIQQQK